MNLTNRETDSFNEQNLDSFHKVVNSIKQVLIEKNKRYGNAALEPLNIFYKGSATDSICIRLDDKLSRIKNSAELRKNDLYDLLGYCLLYAIKCDTNDDSFENKLQAILESSKHHYVNGRLRMNKYLSPYPKEGYLYDGFKKNDIENDIIKSLNGVCSEIKLNNTVKLHLVYRLINFLIVYFIQNNITDFSDLID